MCRGRQTTSALESSVVLERHWTGEGQPASDEQLHIYTFSADDVDELDPILSSSPFPSARLTLGSAGAHSLRGTYWNQSGELFRFRLYRWDEVLVLM